MIEYGSLAWHLLAASVTTGARCVVCGSSDDLVAHHKIPRSFGGQNTRQNLEPVCRDHHPMREVLAKRAARRAGRLEIPNMQRDGLARLTGAARPRVKLRAVQRPKVKLVARRPTPPR